MKSLLIFVSMWAIGTSQPVIAQMAKSSGVFKIVKGVVKIKSGRDGSILKAEIGTRVYPQDTVITEADSRAKIEMIDKNVLNISPSSQIQIQKYEFENEKSKKNVLLNVLYGKVRSQVNQKYDGKTSKFQVVTPAATAGVRGTDFLTGYNASDKSSQVVTFQGKVEWGQPGADGTIQNPVIVQVGETSQAAVNAPPTPPAPLPAGELKKIDSETKAESPSINSNAGAATGNQPTDKTDKDSKKEPQSSDRQQAKESETKGDRISDKQGSGEKSTATEKQTETDRGSDNNTVAKPSGSDGKQPKTEAATPRGPASEGTGTGTGTSANRPAAPAATNQPPPLATTPTTTAPPAAPARNDMFKPGDLAGSGGVAAPPPLPILQPTIGPLPNATLPDLTTMPRCDICNLIIQDGRSNLRIQITTTP